MFMYGYGIDFQFFDCIVQRQYRFRPNFSSQLEFRLTSPVRRNVNFDVPNANPCTKFDVKLGLSVIYGTPEGTFPFQYLSEKKSK